MANLELQGEIRIDNKGNKYDIGTWLLLGVDDITSKIDKVQRSILHTSTDDRFCASVEKTIGDSDVDIFIEYYRLLTVPELQE